MSHACKDCGLLQTPTTPSAPCTRCRGALRKIVRGGKRRRKVGRL